MLFSLTFFLLYSVFGQDRVFIPALGNNVRVVVPNENAKIEEVVQTQPNTGAIPKEPARASSAQLVDDKTVTSDSLANGVVAQTTLSENAKGGDGVQTVTDEPEKADGLVNLTDKNEPSDV